MIRTLLSALSTALIVAACATLPSAAPDAAPMPSSPPAVTAADIVRMFYGVRQWPEPIPGVRDVHSHARPEIARVVNVSLLLTADFDAKVLSGTAQLGVIGRPGADHVVLDTRNLDIHWVIGGDKVLRYELGPEDPILGRSLTVWFDTPTTAEDIFRTVVIAYSTRPDAAALQLSLIHI